MESFSGEDTALFWLSPLKGIRDKTKTRDIHGKSHQEGCVHNSRVPTVEEGSKMEVVTPFSFSIALSK